MVCFIMASMDKKVTEHFQQADPVLYELLVKNILVADQLAPRISADYFTDLCEAIINQQLSEKAGRTIFNRFKLLFLKGKITPEITATLKDQQIRDIGASWSKVKYIKDLSLNVINKEVNLYILKEMPDEEVVKQLTKIKGIGPWTAEMFLMFSLGRENIFSYGDLGLKRAIQKFYKFKQEPTKNQIKKIEMRWKPYRTYACRILWRSLDSPQ